MKIYCLQNIIHSFFVSERQNPFLTHIHFEARERKNLMQRQRQKSCKLCVLSDYHCALWVETRKEMQFPSSSLCGNQEK
jgi:hypothetical protein